MKRFLSLLLGICLLFANTIYPLADDISTDNSPFRDARGNEISQVNLEVGEQCEIYFLSYYEDDFFVWETDNEAVALITWTGNKCVISAEYVGTATVTVKSSSGEAASITVNVSGEIIDGEITDEDTDGNIPSVNPDGGKGDNDTTVNPDGGKDDNDTTVNPDDGKEDIGVTEKLTFYDENGNEITEYHLYLDPVHHYASGTVYFSYPSEYVDSSSWTWQTTDDYIANLSPNVADYSFSLMAKLPGTAYVTVESNGYEIGRLKVITTYGTGDEDEGDEGKDDDDKTDEGKDDDNKGDENEGGSTDIPVGIMPTRVTINGGYDLTLGVGDLHILTYSLYPDGADKTMIVWSAEGNAVRVDDGVIHALKQGNATIYAQNTNGDLLGKCNVTVLNNSTAMTAIKLDKDSLNLKIGDNEYVWAKIEPIAAKEDTLYWYSDDESIASVDEYSGGAGCIYANSEGTTTIRVYNSDRTISATCEVTVERIYVTDITLDKTRIDMFEGDYTYLNASINPSDATSREIEWTSSNTDVATVNYYGEVHGISKGEAVITAKAKDGSGVYAQCTVTVKYNYVTDIALNKTHIDIFEDDYDYLYADIAPSDAANQEIEWTSSNPDVATVNYYGEVHGISKGEAIFTATTEDGGYTATCRVNVTPNAVEGITLNESSVIAVVDDDFRLYEEISPYDATNQNVTWSSSDEAVAEIQATYYGYSGKRIYAKKVGSAIITATTEDGGYSASCTVNVLLDMPEKTLNLIVGNNHTLDFEYNTNVLDGVSWSSSDTSVATVENGVITAVGKGNAEITLSCTYEGQEYAKKCNVTVTGTSGIVTGDVTWRLGGDNATTLYIGGSGELPASWYDPNYEYSVFNTTVTDIVIESGITAVRRNSFREFSNLKKVVISDTVTEIEPYAFYNCSGFAWEVNANSTSFKVHNEVLFSYDMTKLISYPVIKTDEAYEVPSSVTEISVCAFSGNTTFNNTHLKSITLGENVEAVGSYAFEDCKALEKIVINKKLKAINYHAFAGCEPLYVYYYGSRDDWYSISQSESQLTYYKLKCDYVPTTNENGYEYYVKDGKAYITEYTLPITASSFTIADTLGGYPVKVIEEMAFGGGESFSELIIPEGIEEIKQYAFSEINPKKIIIPSSVVSIGWYVFGSGAEEINVSANNTKYTSVDGILFSKDKSVLIRYPEKKSGKTYTVPSDVKLLASNAFAYCSELENVILGENVTTIGYYTFEGCSNLKSVTIPASVNTVEFMAFTYTNSLTDIYYGGTEERWSCIDMQYQYGALDNVTMHYGTAAVSPVYIKTSSSYDDYGYNVYLNNIEIGKTVAIAFYLDDKLVYTEYKTYNGEEYLHFVRDYDLGYIDCVKAMVWEAPDKLIPVCKSAVKVIQID